MKTSRGLFFVNELGIPDDVFLELGLRPVPGNRRPDVDAGDALVRFSHKDPYGNPSEAVYFSHVYGSLGAQGYEMRVRRSLLRRYLVYVWRWCS